MLTFPHLISSLENEIDERTTLDLISKRTSMDEERCRMSAYDNVDRIPKAPPSEVSEVTEFSDPWAEFGQGDRFANFEVSILDFKIVF